MELSLGLQGRQFLLAAVLGLAYGIHFDFLRGLQRNVPWLKHGLDFWFSLTFLLGNLIFALYVGNGEYRIFMLLGTATGLLVYFFTVSTYISRFFTFLWRYLTFPLAYFWRLLKKYLKKMGKIAKKFFSTGKKSVTIKSRQSNRTKLSRREEKLDASAQIVTHYQAHHSDPRDLRHRDHRLPPAKNRRSARRGSAADR